jgi:hypothetical protein
MSHSTLTRPTATHERHEAGPVEGFWKDVDFIMHGRYTQAKTAKERRGEIPSEEDIMQLAHAVHDESLANTDTDDWTTSRLAANYAALVLLEMPEAARAQLTLNRAGHQGPDLDTHIETMAQFNQDLAQALAYMPRSMIPTFTDNLMTRAEAGLGDRHGLDVLRREQFYAVMSGVSREVAFWRALTVVLPEDWTIEPADAELDRKGTDLTIVTGTNERLAIDVKAQRAFDRRLKKFSRSSADRQTLTSDEVNEAIMYGFFYSPMPVTDEVAGPVCIINADHLGDIRDFEYTDTSRVAELVEKLFADRHARQREGTLRKIGKSGIVS